VKTHTAALRSRHANFISRSEGSRCISPCKTPTPSPWTSRRVAWSARDLERGSASEAQPAACAAWGLRACNIYTYQLSCLLCSIFVARAVPRAGRVGEKKTRLRPRKWKSRRLYLPSNHILCSSNAHSVTLHGTRHRHLQPRSLSTGSGTGTGSTRRATSRSPTLPIAACAQMRGCPRPEPTRVAASRCGAGRALQAAAHHRMPLS
jgi:hypothetical protein